MGIRGTIFLALFGLGLVAAFVNPLWGILCYLGHYYLWPERQWWGQILEAAGIRVSLTISAIAAAAVLLHWERLRTRWQRLLHPQEVLLWLYIGAIGLSCLWGLSPDPAYARPVHPFDKMYKVGIFALMLTHVVSTWSDLRRLMTFMVAVGGAYLAWVAWQLPASYFVDGRLEGIGGPDLQDSNFLATHLIGMGILTGVLLLIRPRWTERLPLLVGGAFIANAVILTKSRGAFLGMIAAGVVGLVLADSHVRRRLLWIVPLVVLGGYSLMDEGFVERIGTIFVDEEERDASAQSRLDVWRASLAIFRDYPLGVGADNFFQIIGRYDPRYTGRDTHNTYLRCLTETGILGAILLTALFLNAFRITRSCKRLARELPESTDLVYTAFGLQLMLVAFAVSGLTITMCYTEELFVVLMLPVCLQNALENRWKELLLEESAVADDWESEETTDGYADGERMAVSN